MFKSARWRSDKNRIKAVFKLQFHATPVSKDGGDGLVISVIPADAGKPSAKLEKATIRDGSCYWDTPVHETVKFVREPKTGKINERLYHFLVGKGSSKAGVVGEASLDLSCYALATKISSVSLPLKNSKSDIVLHVSIQRVFESEEQREIEEIEKTAKINSEDRSLRAKLSDGDLEETIEPHVNDESEVSKSINQSAEMNGNRRASSGSDVTTSSSDSSLGLDTQIQVRNDNTKQGPESLAMSVNNGSVHQRRTSDLLAATHEERQKSWDWLGGLSLEASTDDSSGTPREAILRESSQEVQDIVIEKLKSELTSLARQAEMSELELQTLRKQIVKESRKGQDLSREINKLREERDIFKEECEKFKALQTSLDEAKKRNKLQSEGGDPHTLILELRQELNHEKDLNNNLRIQLEKTQESNSELILAVRDLDEMLEQKNTEISNLMQKHAEKTGTESTVEESGEANYECKQDDDDEQRALEEIVKEHSDERKVYLLEQKILDLQSEIEIYRREKDEVEMQMEQLALDYEILKQENHDMSYKLEQSQLQEQLKMQYECTSSFGNLHELESQIEKLEIDLKKKTKDFADSSNIISELEGEVKSLENELKQQSDEFSNSLITISELQAHIRSLENEVKERSHESSASLITINKLQTQVTSLENEIREQAQEHSDSSITISELEDHVKTLEEALEKQALEYEADMEALTSAKVEQEQRAIRAEESLRKMRWQNASTAERLQEEFKKLSSQMASTFEANESVAAKALNEANELRLQKRHLEDKLEKASEELQLVRDNYEARLHELSSKLISMSNHVEELQSEIQHSSLQHDNQVKQAEEAKLQLTEEIQTLKAENKVHSIQAKERESLTIELEEMRRSSNGMEELLKQARIERAELRSRVALLKEKEQTLLGELKSLQYEKDEKDSTAKVLQLEVDNLRVKCEELMKTLSEDELEKENLRKQLLQCKGELKRKEDACHSMEKKIKESNNRIPVSDLTKATPRSNKLQNSPRSSKEVANLKEKINLLEGQIKQKETALENSTNSFLEKEKDLQNKIEELELRLEVLNRNTSRFCEENSNEVPQLSKDHPPVDQSTKSCVTEQNGAPSIESPETLPQKELKRQSPDSSVHEMLSEMTMLKERNKLMEDELKEMQERYSEISLKFAEVEGERQQLVMRLRNIKNAKKSP
ncbi:OLC1v1029643C1 [Oldenlandia corymbosa var. corymbosa]|uniref:OLC1v1029643C1 n=1 Tax=Oldenlandia corymbosa var. corymbosa TaxID=529605 RepID=A0AAV1CE94_OLDCO|nr:OLC1v1029643C1 [Oldenlandia corymbosa var. corymbosa]